MDTSYNIAINELKLRKLAAEREVCSMIVERDKLKNELAELRRASTVVIKEKNDAECKIQKLREMENAEALALVKLRQDFAESSIREEKRKSEINAQILALEEANAKAERFVDYSEENEKAEMELKKAKSQLEKARKDLETIKTERLSFDKYKEDTRQALEEERAKYMGYMKSLELREERISLSEKRLEKYKQELLSKK